MSSSNIALIIPLADAHRSRKTGAKAADLSRLVAARFDVPRGFVISSDAYRAHLWAAGVREVAAAAREAEDREQVRSAIMSSPIPDDIQLAIEKAYEQLCWQLGEREPKLAVRPSPEDTGPGAEMPGAYESYLNVTGADALLTAIKRVWASVWCGKAAAYRARFGTAAEPAMAVLVQQMVDATQFAGVCTADPVTGDPLRPSATLSSANGPASRHTVDLGGPADDSRADALLAVERSILIEDVLGGRVEVEWADDGRRSWVLQARVLRDTPAFFPGAAVGSNERWKLAAPVPVSHFSRSLLARQSRTPEASLSARWVVNGFVYRRAISDSEAKRLTGPAPAERALAKWRKDASPALRDSALRSLSRDPGALDAVQLRDAITATADRAVEALDWLDSASLFASGLTATLRPMIPEDGLFHRLLSGALGPLALRDAELQELADRFAEAEKSGKLTDAAWWMAYKNDVAAFARCRGFAFAHEAEILDIASWQSWVEDSDPVFRLIAAMGRRESRPSVAACHSAALDTAQEAAREIEKARRGALKQTLGLAREWIAASAECEMVCALTASALRRLVAEMGCRLHASGALGDSGDVFQLGLDDIANLPEEPSAEDRAAARRLVAARKHEGWLNRRLIAPATLPAPSTEVPPSKGPVEEAAIAGTAAGIGTVAGCARMVSRETDVSEFNCGDILVLAGDAHAWTPLLAVAGGLICGDADDLCCAALLAGDFGIPVVAECAEAPRRIRDGQKVTLDGGSGCVELHGRAAHVLAH